MQFYNSLLKNNFEITRSVNENGREQIYNVYISNTTVLAKTIFVKSHVHVNSMRGSNFSRIAHKNFMKHVNSIYPPSPCRSKKIGARRKSIVGFPTVKVSYSNCKLLA